MQTHGLPWDPFLRKKTARNRLMRTISGLPPLDPVCQLGIRGSHCAESEGNKWFLPHVASRCSGRIGNIPPEERDKV